MRELELAVHEEEVEGTEDENVTLIPIVELRPDPDDPEGEPLKERIFLRAHRPGTGQLGYLLASAAKGTTQPEQVAGLLNFFGSILEDDDQAYIRGRLLERTDPFGLEHVNDIMEDLIEEWSARPTKQPSDFASSQKAGGQKSKQRTPRSISSSAASASS